MSEQEVRLVWPEDTEAALEQMTKDADAWNRTRPQDDPDEGRTWATGWLEAKRRAWAQRKKLRDEEREARERPSRIYVLTAVFNSALGLDHRAKAPRGYVPGPEPTEDDLDLIALERYLEGVRDGKRNVRKLEAMARRQVAANMLQRNPERAPHEIAEKVGMRPKTVYAVREGLRSNGLIPPE